MCEVLSTSPSLTLATGAQLKPIVLPNLLSPARGSPSTRLLQPDNHIIKCSEQRELQVFSEDARGVVSCPHLYRARSMERWSHTQQYMHISKMAVVAVGV
jgi:hypothetical protein